MTRMKLVATVKSSKTDYPVTPLLMLDQRLEGTENADPTQYTSHQIAELMNETDPLTSPW